MINKSRGIVILFEDITPEWIELMKEGRLTALGVHKLSRPGDDCIGRLFAELNAPDGRKLLNELEKAGIRVEYELHSLEWLLPRSLFDKEPELFRAGRDGERTNDCNFCPTNAHALEIISENAYKLAKGLHQDSDNYFLWLDDAADSYCCCPKCREELPTGSDQCLTAVNAIARGLKAYNTNARTAYLAYADALQIPKVKPDSNVFLEFAPMNRNHNKPLHSKDEKQGMMHAELLNSLLTVFKPEETHVLEYWLDNALFSGYKLPPVKVPFNTEVAKADVQFYTSKGIQNIKTFGSFINREYFELHGKPPIKEYGDILAEYIEI